MKGNGQPGSDKAGLEKLPKAKLIAMILERREDTRIRLAEKDKRITEVSEQLAKLQGEIDKEKAGQKIKDINKHVNQPTSKKPEWDKDGNPKPATKGQKEHILTFIKHEGAPHHNNYGEYIIKKGVVKRKMSGGCVLSRILCV